MSSVAPEWAPHKPAGWCSVGVHSVKQHTRMAITIAHNSSIGQYEIYHKQTHHFSHGAASICPRVHFQTW